MMKSFTYGCLRARSWKNVANRTLELRYELIVSAFVGCTAKMTRIPRSFATVRGASSSLSSADTSRRDGSQKTVMRFSVMPRSASKV
jgi:hypothetical protein